MEDKELAGIIYYLSLNLNQYDKSSSLVIGSEIMSREFALEFQDFEVKGERFKQAVLTYNLEIYNKDKNSSEDELELSFIIREKELFIEINSLEFEDFSIKSVKQFHEFIDHAKKGYESYSKWIKQMLSKNQLNLISFNKERVSIIKNKRIKKRVFLIKKKSDYSEMDQNIIEAINIYKEQGDLVCKKCGNTDKFTGAIEHDVYGFTIKNGEYEGGRDLDDYYIHITCDCGETVVLDTWSLDYNPLNMIKIKRKIGLINKGRKWKTFTIKSSEEFNKEIFDKMIETGMFNSEWDKEKDDLEISIGDKEYYYKDLELTSENIVKFLKIAMDGAEEEAYKGLVEFAWQFPDNFSEKEILDYASYASELYGNTKLDKILKEKYNLNR